MNFHSLLFSGQRTEKNMDYESCEDLKLTALLGEDTVGMMLYAPTAENIALRQEMFAELLSNAEEALQLSEMERVLSIAAKLYRSQNKAVCEAVDIYIFPHLFAYIAEFSRMAASLTAKSRLLSRFKSVFAEICEDKRFSEAEAEAPEVKAKLAEASGFYIRTESENARLQKESAVDITESLKGCAKELGVPLRARENRAFLLQKGMAEALPKLYPEAFAAASDYYSRYRTLLYGAIFEYLDELKFIISVLNFTHKADCLGIPHSFPAVSNGRKLSLHNVYDVTLTLKTETGIVPNDAEFSADEPFFYLTGANGGGKTTYLRAIGCAVMLFLAGAPVFCDGGECPVFDSVLTHFPKDERFEGSGRFFDEIRRVEQLLAAQNGNSLVLLNETYATTGEDKAREYTDKLARQLYSSGNFGLYITHQHDVKEAQIPFLGVVVDEQDKNRRTYRIEKRRLPPRSFARDILEKYGLTTEALKARFGV